MKNLFVAIALVAFTGTISLNSFAAVNGTDVVSVVKQDEKKKDKDKKACCKKDKEGKSCSKEEGKEKKCCAADKKKEKN